jgi:hypothetical protein
MNFIIFCYLRWCGVKTCSEFWESYTPPAAMIRVKEILKKSNMSSSYWIQKKPFQGRVLSNARDKKVTPAVSSNEEDVLPFYPRSLCKTWIEWIRSFVSLTFTSYLSIHEYVYILLSYLRPIPHLDQLFAKDIFAYKLLKCVCMVIKTERKFLWENLHSEIVPPPELFLRN